MNAGGQNLTGSIDLDDTAELPVLDESALIEGDVTLDGTLAMPALTQPPAGLDDTDSWRRPPTLPPLPEAAAPAASPAPKVPTGPRLEDELRALRSGLEDLQRRLTERGQRLSAVETQLAESRQAHQGATDHARALEAELAGAHAAITGHQAQIQALQQHIERLEVDQQSAAERERSLQAEAARREQDLQDSVARKKQEVLSTLAQQTEQAQSEANWLKAAAARLQGELEQERGRSAALLENLQTLEGRRGIFDAQLRELDDQLQVREQKVGLLAAEVDHGSSRASADQQELDARARRISDLESEVARLSASLGDLTREAAAAAAAASAEISRLGEQNHELQASNGSQAAAHEALSKAHDALTEAHRQLEQKHAGLQARHEGAMDELRELEQKTQEDTAAVQQVAAQYADHVAQLQLAETRAHDLTAQLNDRNRVVAELTRSNSELLARLEEARTWLDERDSLLQRLEAEAVQSQVLMGSIQRSIHQLTPSGNTGPHKALKLDAVRTLVRHADGREVVHKLGQRTTIGRTPDNDLQIDASYISRHHAVVLASDTQVIIEDLNSTNGVYVNGRRINRQLLADGDSVIVGKASFIYSLRVPDPS